MTRPDVIISGPDEAPPPRRLPRWLRRGVASVLVLGVLVALALRVASDERRRQVALRAADEVDAAVRISEAGLGAGGTVVVGVQVVGRGGELRVDRPHVHPGMLRVDVVGAPLTVAADRGNQIRLRLLPLCSSALTLTRLEIDLPVTPASGRQHQLRVPVPSGPALVRRACGYLPVDEALTVTTSHAAVVGQRLQVSFLVRNDGREPLTVRGVQAPGLEVLEPNRPVPLPPGGRSVLLQVLLRATACALVPEDPLAGPGLSVQVEGEGGSAVLRPSFEPVAREYRAWRAAACPLG